MKRYILIALPMLVPVLLALLSLSRVQTEKDKRFFESEIRPLVVFVTTHRNRTKRLPTKEEFAVFLRESKSVSGEWYFPQKPKGTDDWGNNGVDFIVGAWRGEWAEYYQSWDGDIFRRHNSPLTEQ